MREHNNRTERIGVMGGTFDPIHYGHLFAAEEARLAMDLDRVLFIPAGTPPHKSDAEVTPARRRYDMTLLAVADNPYFEVSDLEILRSGSSYTVDTLRELRQQYTGADFFLIIGTDTMLDLIHWKTPLDIARLSTIVVIKRAGYDATGNLPVMIQSALRTIETTPLEISSTDIRQRVRVGESVKYLLPPPVAMYIMKNHLYTNSDGEPI